MAETMIMTEKNISRAEVLRRREKSIVSIHKPEFRIQNEIAARRSLEQAGLLDQAGYEKRS